MQQRFMPLMHYLTPLCGAGVGADREGDAPVVKRDRRSSILVANGQQVATPPEIVGLPLDELPRRFPRLSMLRTMCSR
jgi:hypothetical protein